MRSSTASPTVFRPMSNSATVLACVDVCGARVGRAGRTVSFLVVGFASLLLLTFLERVDLHPIIISARYISSCHGRIRSKVSGCITPLQQSCSKSGTVGIRTQLQTVPEKIGAIFIITVANAVPEARSYSPTSSSQALKPDSKP